MKETCEFWVDHLKALPDGRLVVPDGWSPEHGPVEDGVSYNQEIVWDLFNNTVAAADALGGDREFRDKIAAMRDKLVTPGIGSWGQLLEWMTELHDPKYPELDTPNDHHRHTSHLFAVYPGAQISTVKTPRLAAAAKVSHQRSRHCAGQRRARMVVCVAHRPLCTAARRRSGARHAPAIVLPSQHLPQPVWPASADAD